MNGFEMQNMRYNRRRPQPRSRTEIRVTQSPNLASSDDGTIARNDDDLLFFSDEEEMAVFYDEQGTSVSEDADRTQFYSLEVRQPSNSTCIVADPELRQDEDAARVYFQQTRQVSNANATVAHPELNREVEIRSQVNRAVPDDNVVDMRDSDPQTQAQFPPPMNFRWRLFVRSIIYHVLITALITYPIRFLFPNEQVHEAQPVDIVLLLSGLLAVFDAGHVVIQLG